MYHNRADREDSSGTSCGSRIEKGCKGYEWVEIEESVERFFAKAKK